MNIRNLLAKYVRIRISTSDPTHTLKHIRLDTKVNGDTKAIVSCE